MTEALDFSMKKMLASPSQMRPHSGDSSKTHPSPSTMHSPQSSDSSAQSPHSTTPAALAGFPTPSGLLPFSPFNRLPGSQFPSPMDPFGLGALGIPTSSGMLLPQSTQTGFPGGLTGAGLAGLVPTSGSASLLGSIPDPAYFPTASLALSTLHRRRRSSTATSNASRDSMDASPHKKPGQSVPETDKDEQYWERRRKNNEAAKRSRDQRRAKEEEIAMRAAVLEQENLKLRAQVALLKNETAKLHLMLYSSVQQGGSLTNPSTNSVIQSPTAKAH